MINSFNKIVDGLYLGSCPWEEDITSIQEQNINSVLSLTNHDDYVNWSKYGILYVQVRFDDGNLPTIEQMDYCLSYIRWNMNQGNKTLVHCDAGISRSSFVVAYYMIKRYAMKVDDAIGFIRSKRPIIDPYSGYIHMLRSINNEAITESNSIL